MRDPWKMLLRNIKTSAMCPGGNRAYKAILTEEMQSKKRHLVEVTAKDLEEMFEQQNRKCYWFDIPLNPMDVFVTRHPLAISADRIDCSGHYTVDNIVICSRMANLGRGSFSAYGFKQIVTMILPLVEGKHLVD